MLPGRIEVSLESVARLLANKNQVKNIINIPKMGASNTRTFGRTYTVYDNPKDDQQFPFGVLAYHLSDDDLDIKHIAKPLDHPHVGFERFEVEPLPEEDNQ